MEIRFLMTYCVGIMRINENRLVPEFKRAFQVLAVANLSLAASEIPMLSRDIDLLRSSSNFKMAFEIAPVILVSAVFISSSLYAALSCQQAIKNCQSLSALKQASRTEFYRNSVYCAVHFAGQILLHGLSIYAGYHQQRVALFMNDRGFIKTSLWLALLFIFNALAHRGILKNIRFVERSGVGRGNT